MLEAIVHTGKNMKTTYRGEVMSVGQGQVTIWCKLKNGAEKIKSFREDATIIQMYKDGKLI